MLLFKHFNWPVDLMHISEQTLNQLRENDPDLISLDFSDIYGPGLDEDDIIHLFEALEHNTILKTLSLAGNGLSEETLHALARNTSLISLDLTCCELGDEGLEIILQNQNLRTLILQENGIEENGLRALARNTTLTSLNLEFNQLGNVGARIIAQNTTLESLDLTNNNIENIGAEALTRNNTLKTLILKCNNIDIMGVHALARNKTLTYLDLSCNDFSDSGVTAFVNNTTLRTLIIEWDDAKGPLSNESAITLAKNKTLTTLSLAGQSIGNDGAEALALNTSLTKLNLSYNFIGPAGTSIFARNSTLTSLNLTLNRGSIELVYPWFLENYRLHVLELDISPAQRTQLAEHLTENRRRSRRNEVNALTNAAIILLSIHNLNSDMVRLVMAYLPLGNTVGERILMHTNVVPLIFFSPPAKSNGVRDEQATSAPTL